MFSQCEHRFTTNLQLWADYLWERRPRRDSRLYRSRASLRYAMYLHPCRQRRPHNN